MQQTSTEGVYHETQMSGEGYPLGIVPEIEV